MALFKTCQNSFADAHKVFLAKYKWQIFLPGLFVCRLFVVPFCSGAGFGCAALAEVFWPSFCLTDRGTVGMGGSFSLHDSPSASVSAFVILWSNKKNKNTSCLVLKDASSETAVCAMINASVGVINISRQLVLTPRTTSEQVDRKMSGCEYNSNNTNLLMYLVFLAEQDRRIFDYNRSVMLFYPHSSPRRLLEVM